jgi:ribosomal-protein-alanine N-acetyltransferase
MELRKFSLEDSARITELLQDEKVSKWTSNIPFPYSETHAIEWIEGTSKDDHRSPYAIEVNSEIIGCVSYWFNSELEIEIGYWLGKGYWGQGYSTKALTKMLSLSDFPAVPKIVAKVMIENIGSQRVLLKCGFTYKSDCYCQKQGNKVDAKFYTKETTT